VVELSGHLQSQEEAMRNLWKSVLVALWVIGMGLGVSAPAQAASGVGPYYAMPAWDQQLPASTRFIVLSNWIDPNHPSGGAAVLDRETGLVWEQSPSTSTFNWFNASFHCLNLNAGGRTGWRFPTIQELLSLVDRSVLFPALPSGHPFTNVQPFAYWSATTAAAASAIAWSVFFFGGFVADFLKSNTNLAWCVRGGQGPDAQ
jgi:hypothetical protein